MSNVTAAKHTDHTDTVQFRTQSNKKIINTIRSHNMQIMTGIEVNSEADFPKLPEYCPSAEGTRAIFTQLWEISLTIDR